MNTVYKHDARDCKLVGMPPQNQSGYTTQIRTHPRATEQGRVKCRCHVTVPAVLTQEAIPEEGG